MVEEIKKLAVTNNTAGASIFDLGKIMQSESMAEINTSLKATEEKANKVRQEDYQEQEKLKQMEIESRLKEKQMDIDHKDLEAEKNRRRDILVAEIRAAGYGAMQDINENKQSDFLDALGEIKNSEEFQANMNLQTSKETNKVKSDSDRLQIEREKIAAQDRLKQIDLKIAEVNKNKFDKKEPAKKKK
jgi:hypothetical protein